MDYSRLMARLRLASKSRGDREGYFRPGTLLPDSLGRVPLPWNAYFRTGFRLSFSVVRTHSLCSSSSKSSETPFGMSKYRLFFILRGFSRSGVGTPGPDRWTSQNRLIVFSLFEQSRRYLLRIRQPALMFLPERIGVGEKREQTLGDRLRRRFVSAEILGLRP